MLQVVFPLLHRKGDLPVEAQVAACMMAAAHRLRPCALRDMHSRVTARLQAANTPRPILFIFVFLPNACSLCRRTQCNFSPWTSIGYIVSFLVGCVDIVDESILSLVPLSCISYGALTRNKHPGPSLSPSEGPQYHMHTCIGIDTHSNYKLL